LIDRNKIDSPINKVFASSIHSFPCQLWCDRIHHSTIGKKIKILYAVRTNTRKLDNTSHSMLCSILKKYDSTICDMGTLPIEKQIETFRNHNVVIGVHGNNLSGIMWMKPESFVFEILPLRFKNTVYDYHCMSLCMKHHYTQIDCHARNLSSTFSFHENSLYTIENVI
jgi:capsular polysaccharide biosynthesis protein